MSPRPLQSRSGRSRRLAGALAAAGLLAVFAPGAGAHAAHTPTPTPSAGVQSQREQAKADLDDISAELVAANQAVLDADKQLPIARAQAEAARKAEADARAKDADLGRRLKEAHEAQAAAQARYGDAAKKLDAADEEAGRLAVDMYDGAQGAQLEALVTADNPQEVADQLQMLDTVGSIQADSVLQLGAVRAVTAAQRAHLEAVRAEADRLKKEAATALATASTARADAQRAEQAVVALVAARKKAASDLEQRKQVEVSRLAELDAQAAALSRQLAQRAGAAGATGTTPADSGGVLQHPVDAPMTSPFGPRFHPILHITRMHTGQDFSSACGAPVVAAADGVVVSAGWSGGYGNRVVIDHGLQKGVSLATTYNHLTSIGVHSGTVRRGQLIGTSGTSGLSTGCHLHFETLVNGTYVDPTAWF